MDMQVKADFRKLDALLVSLGRNARPIISRALNRTATETRTAMTRIVTEELNVRAGEVRGKIKIKKASQADLLAIVSRSGKPLGLMTFIGTRATKKGISVKVKKSGARTRLRHAFFATMKSGHRGIFQRREQWHSASGRAGSSVRGYAARLPIEELAGPRVEDILGKPENLRELETKQAASLAKRVLHEMERELGKHG